MADFILGLFTDILFEICVRLRRISRRKNWRSAGDPVYAAAGPAGSPSMARSMASISI